MSVPNPSTALATVLVDELVRNGVTRFVISPGSRSAGLALAAVSNPGVNATVALDERSAGFAALGMGKAGEPAAVIVTSGTAVANLFPAVVEAEMSRSPLILLTADRPPELRDVGANQAIDQINVFGRHVRWFSEVGVAEDREESNAYWRSTACHAVAAATGGAPGPVHLNIAFREPLVPLSDDSRVSSPPFASPIAGRPGGRVWTAFAEPNDPESMLPSEFTAAERGLVVVGPGSFGPWRADRLAATLGWPLIAEPVSGGRPPQSITAAHLLASNPGFAAEHRPDVVLAIGRVGLSRQVGRLLHGARTVVADTGGWSDTTRHAEVVLAGHPIVDPAAVPPRTGGWRRSWFEAERIARTALDSALDEFEGMSEMRVARDTALAAGPILVVASSMPVRDLDIVMPACDVRVFANRGASGIDGFVSTTLGVASVAGPSVALAGDLSMLHDQNGFLTDPRPDAVFTVINNDGGGIFSFLPQADLPEHFERLFGTPHGRSFERYAQFHGLRHQLVDDPDRLTAAIASARNEKGIHLIEVRTEREGNVKAHQRVTAAVHEALDGNVER